MLDIVEFLLLLVGSLVIKSLDSVPNGANISFQLTDQRHDLARVAENLHALRVRVVSETEWTLNGGAELAHLQFGVLEAVGSEICLLEGCYNWRRLASDHRVKLHDVRVVRHGVLQLGNRRQ